MNLKHKPEDYTAIAFWAKHLRKSSSQEVRELQEQAAREEAPLHAVFKYENGSGWMTLDEVTDKRIRAVAINEGYDIKPTYQEHEISNPIEGEWYSYRTKEGLGAGQFTEGFLCTNGCRIVSIHDVEIIKRIPSNYWS